MTISPISLGNTFTNTSGSTVLGGLSSGLNTQSVINSIVAAQSSQITTLQDQVTVNNSQASAITTLQNLLTALQTAAAPIASPNSPDTSNNLWAVNTSNITSNTSQAASNFLTADVASGTATGSYTISNITSLATNSTQDTAAFTVSESTTPIAVASGAVAGQFNAGTITINGPSGSGDVTINAGDTLDEVAADFNAATSSTGLTAVVTQSSPGVFTLGFTNGGSAYSFDLTSSSDVTSDPSGVLSAQTNATYTLDPAVNPVVVASGATSGQFTAGTLSITGPLGSGTVTLNAGDTLSQVAADFNAASASTGISATALQTSAGQYKLVFSSTITGENTGFDLTSGTTVTSGASLLSNVTFGTANTGTDAKFYLNGEAIDRSTNTISDLVSGVTFNLLQVPTEAGSSFNLSITPDYNSIAAGIENFATAYNNFLTFYAQQTQLNSSGTPASAAVLYSDTTLRTIYDQVTNEANNIVGGISGSNNPNQLLDIGLTFATQAANGTNPEVDNILSVDSASLLSELQSNFTGVENVFGSNITAKTSGGEALSDLSLFQSPTNAGVTSFTLNVSESGTSTIQYTDPSTNQSVTVNLTQTSLTTGGVALTVPAGSGALAGMELIYGSNTDASGITVNLSQGVADQLNNSITSALTQNTGLIAEDLSAIQTKNTSIQTQITSVTNQVANTRQQLLQKFANLEAAISSANSSLDLLNAQQLAASSSGG